MEIEELYKQWCKETSRSGGILCPGSIHEFFRWLKNNQPPKMYHQVKKFSEDMQSELKANEPKKGTEWKTWDDVPAMLDELEYHEDKLLNAMFEKDNERIREYLADCGNILMFIGNAYKLYD